MVKSDALWTSRETFAYCLLTVETFASNTRPEPPPIAPGATVIEKSALYPLPPSVTVMSVTALPETIMFAFSPVPDPPVRDTSKYCPFVNPEPPFETITSSTKLPWVKDDSKIIGDSPRSNSIIVPVGIVLVRGLLREIVVKPPTVVTPVMFVFDWIPVTVFLTSCPTNTSEFVVNTNWEEPEVAEL